MKISFISRLHQKRCRFFTGFCLVAVGLSGLFCSTSLAMTTEAYIHYQKGLVLEQQNNLVQAQAEYQTALALDPYDSLSYIHLANLVARQGKTDEALQLYQKALDTPPHDAMIYLSIAKLWEAKHQPQKALAAYQSLVTLQPQYAYVYLPMARLQVQLHQLDAAKAYYKTFLAIYPRDTEVNLEMLSMDSPPADPEKAAQMYRAMLANSPSAADIQKSLAESILKVGDGAFHDKHYEDAIARYQEALHVSDSVQIPALVGVANSQYALHQEDAAYLTYQQVLKKDPQNLTARLNKAQLDLNRKNDLEAMENLRWIVHQKPDFFEAYKLLAETHENLGDYGKAILYYRQALSLHPKDSLTLMGYGNVWREVGDLDRAQKAYEMAKDESPNNALIHYNLGSIYNLKNNLGASVSEYNAALHFDPDFVEAYYGMGVTFEKEKKPKDALKAYHQYLEKAPSTANYVTVVKQRMRVLEKLQAPSTASASKT